MLTMFDSSELDRALVALGELLASRGLGYRLAVVGGGAMLLAGLLQRPTQDLDVVAQVGEGSEAIDELPPGLQAAVADVAAALDLPADWLNTGPSSLFELGLPDGFIERAETRRYGPLELWLADRLDQIHFKLYAAVDQGPASKHFADLRALGPTAQELDDAARWAQTHDPSEAFASELHAAVDQLASERSDER